MSSVEEQKLIDERKLSLYRQKHSFSRETFIAQVRMMHQVSVDLKEKPRLNSSELEKIDTWTDEQLTKAHKFYWDKL
jgi:hypothetical protein